MFSINIDENLEYLSDELKNMGYAVYRISDKKYADVVIYSGKVTHLSSLDSSLGGVFLINGDGKSGADIENIIKCRAYSPLF
ncbi:MAG: YkuS family protein [Clostridiales bacterium]|nr:YkuS family protein [Clostridiales bacterium]HBM80797.1 hypothetical protein [Clostridiaceae bacterium]